VELRAGVTHGGRLGLIWGIPSLKVSGAGAILKASAEENR
jgi:hypothetical protein